MHIDFQSDNVWGAAPEVSLALSQTPSVARKPYGFDDISEQATALIREIFEHKEAQVFFVGTGTASNSLALSCLTPPYGFVYCSDLSHINVNECGAPEFYTGGAKLVYINHEHGVIQLDDFKDTVTRHIKGNNPFSSNPATLSVTQTTECGTIYPTKYLRQLTEFAHKNQLYVHMDGARFSNAVAALGESPADLSWRSGVDILSFGLTKNGAWVAESVIIFNPELAQNMSRFCKRSGQVYSKAAFIAQQYSACLTDNNWLRYATHTNEMGAKIANVFSSSGYKLVHPAQSNQVFVEIDPQIQARIREHDIRFYTFSRVSDSLTRFVAGIGTTLEDVKRLGEVCAKL